MVRITEEHKLHKTSLFYDNGVYRFALNTSGINPSLLHGFEIEINKTIDNYGGKNIKSRKSKGKVNFRFEASDGQMAENCFYESILTYEKFIEKYPNLEPQTAQQQTTQDDTTTTTNTQQNIPFKEGDELVELDNIDIGLFNTIEKIIGDRVIIDGNNYDINVLKGIAKSRIALPDVRYNIAQDDYYYDEKGNLGKLHISKMGVEFNYYDNNKRLASRMLPSKYFTAKWFSYMIETGRWKQLTINLFDVFGYQVDTYKKRYEITNVTNYSSGREFEIKTITTDMVLLVDNTTLNLMPENEFENFLWINNIPKLVDAEETRKKYDEIQYTNDLEKKVIDLKDELKNLVQLREVINDVDFEDKFNVNSMIKETQKQIDKANAEILEQKIGSDNFFDALFEQSFKPLANRYDNLIEKNKNETLLAPNGEISDLPLELHKVIRSRDFIEWFGDWKYAYMYRNLPDMGGENLSKAISEKFEPLLVWHGTNSEFSFFRFDNFPANYFAVNRQYSEFFATARAEDGVGYVLPFFINVKNPLDLTLFGNDKVSNQEFFDWIYLQTGKKPSDLEVEEIFTDPTTPPMPVWVFLRNNPKMLVNIAQKTNFDSIIFYEFNPNIEDVNNPAYSTLAYIIFDPHQVKLADPERGEILLTELKSFLLKRGGKI